MTQKITKVSALVAIAVVFELFVKFVLPLFNMPFGGNFLGISMIPLVLVGFLFGIKYGVIAGFIYGLIEILLAPSGYIIGWSFLLDYLVGFTAFGLTGLFKSRFSSVQSIVLGVLLAGFIRYLSVSIAGVIFWSEVINADAFVYSFFIYNPWYNLTTTLITLTILLLLRKRLPVMLGL
jgi:thiamine transporter